MKLTKLFSSLLLVFIMGSTSVMAQTPTMPQPQEKIEVSDSELTQFAQVFQQMRMINQKAQQEMIAVVQDEEFELQRFNEIHQAKMDPNKEVETSEEEDKKYELVVAELETIQPKFQKEMQEVISESELSMERYQQVAMALRTDAELQKRLQEIMQS
ncbi:DUF4168 domain-containing protein [Christiangramia crocea]|uniref:DUF4168 domain-containing protein n=1 Tax=Christiangramia crocea TaxID=2904124 RepID=A0A9X2A994_9FLAO|nr:DUF4168 domain-containing protein [Gramella crocea]MCG9973322.1 DUF4168 domain-containing protein [Gramella crocea]